ncbi:MAG: ABC transporter permease subunit [Actinophytocola sp.]|uniref:ABC transporter permease n=1 Tax=Actinophytocola sp. TaxID=1872138 RepID=UPI001324B3EF|nr:ABC transporter permease [Actinophytocola sp.]MPZ81526.1 ABC transporter permease subunit [Actinophytocola sp.]
MSGSEPWTRKEPRPSRTIYLVARRELNSRLRTRSFVVSTIVSLVVLIGFVLTQSTLFDEERVTRVGLNGQSNAIAGPLEDAAAQLDHHVETREVTDLAAGREMVADSELDALVSGAPADLSVLVRGDLDPDLRNVLNGLVQQQVLSGLLASVEDLDSGEVLATVAKAGVRVESLEPADPQHDQRLALALIIVALLYLSLLLYGSMVAQGVVEEKSSRVVELLLATVRPWQLLSGKVLGLGLVGLIQLFTIGIVGLLLAIITGVLTISGTAAGTLAWGLLWYLLGYLLYATVFAAVGSLVSRQEDVQSVLMPITMALVVGFVLGFAVISRSPAGTTATVLSLLPPLSPILMPGRIALAAAPLWQVGLAIVLTLATVVLLARIGGAVYRNSVLHMGPRLRLRDVLR